REREVTGWQTIQRYSAAPRYHAQGLFECDRRNSRNQHALRTAISFFFDIGRRIIMRLGIDGHRRAKLPREIKLSVVDVDSGNVKPHCLGILHRHMAETTDTGDHNPVTGLGVGYLEALVNRYASTENRRDFVEIDILRQMADKIRIGNDIFGKATIDR